MPTLPDLFDRLAEHGDHAGGDTVVERARRAARVRSVPTPVLVERAPRPHRLARVLVAAAVTVAIVAVPLAVRVSDRPARVSREPSGPAYPPPASATAEQLARMHWSAIAPPPLPVSIGNQILAWAGDELVVFGEDALHEDPHGMGAAYDPSKNTWRRLPRAPLKGDFFFDPSWVWTGRELVVFPGAGPDTMPARGEAYSPRTNSWRVLAPAPLCSVPRAGIAWTGHVIVMAGGYNLSGSQCSTTGAAGGATYDPRTDRWTPGPTLPVRRGYRLEATRLVFAADRIAAIVATQSIPGNPKAQNNGAIVTAYSWALGSNVLQRLGAITEGQMGATTRDDWDAYSNGSQLVFPPSTRYCGEGTVIACSVGGVFAGSVYDVATGARRTLVTPVGAKTSADASVFTGAALATWISDGTTSPGYAWDVATGRRVSLPAAPERVLAATWTGNAVVAVAARALGRGFVMLRLG
jgi:hypothetical protein